MSEPVVARGGTNLALRGELRCGWELARLAADPQFLRPRRRTNAPPVLLVPGFMAGDQSLAVLRGWLRRRGSTTASAGMWLNIDCAERAVRAIEIRLRRLAEQFDKRVAIIGQSRGGELARAVAVRNPGTVETLVMLGSPVLDPLSVGPAVLRAVRSVARLGDLGISGLFSTKCADGPCCAAFREDLMAPIPEEVRTLAVYSRSDGIVSWRACLDPWAEHVEVASSHIGMSCNREVFGAISEILDENEEER
ncbi:MAG: hypothetical protein JOZ73_10920 [Solirubrobacterales bacterium]|nr:hypothetical protein [Solirubrobacterales bacterium]